jgi:hypothetical protein
MSYNTVPPGTPPAASGRPGQRRTPPQSQAPHATAQQDPANPTHRSGCDAAAVAAAAAAVAAAAAAGKHVLNLAAAADPAAVVEAAV